MQKADPRLDGLLLHSRHVIPWTIAPKGIDLGDSVGESDGYSEGNIDHFYLFICASAAAEVRCYGRRSTKLPFPMISIRILILDE